MKKIILSIGIAILLLIQIASAKNYYFDVSDYMPIKNFYFENGEEINLTMMEWLLYNADFSIALSEDEYFVKIANANNKTNKPCLILRFLRKHPEILLRFPEIEGRDDNANTWRIDGVDCLKTQGGSSNTPSTGGGGGAAAVSKIADSKAHMWQKIMPNQVFSLNVNKSTISVTKIEATNGNNVLRNVELEVQALVENPVSKEAAAKVYQYLRINKKNAKDADGKSFKISFRVAKAWLAENNLASGNITLYRYKNGWNELAARVTGTDAVYVNYKADAPGFSSFAVGVKSGIDTEEKVPEEVPEEEAPPEEVLYPAPVERKKPMQAPVAWIVAAVIEVIGIILIVFYQKRKGDNRVRSNKKNKANL